MRWLGALSFRADAVRASDCERGGLAGGTLPRILGAINRAAIVIGLLASAVVLTGCETSTKLGDIFKVGSSEDPQTTATVPKPADEADASFAAAPGLLGSDAYDDLNTGKTYYRSGNHGLAERYFRRAVESHPNDGEAWLGLAACYDQLRRFELADRAYTQVFRLVGKTPEVLNNQGYSYLLRGDYRRARQTLLQARAMDPSNPYVQNNLELLAKSARKRKAVDN